jgi:hypothetical protein
LEPWALETLHNTTELKLQSGLIRDSLKQRILSSPTKSALNQLVKGYELAMNSAVLLAEENRQLRTENARQVKKRAKKRRFIATGGTLTIQEGLALSEPTVEPAIEAVGRVATDEPVVRPRAPRTCSICRFCRIQLVRVQQKRFLISI